MKTLTREIMMEWIEKIRDKMIGVTMQRFQLGTDEEFDKTYYKFSPEIFSLFIEATEEILKEFDQVEEDCESEGYTPNYRGIVESYIEELKGEKE